MNKKQRNRKIVQQNKRNRIINRRYTSTIKNLIKNFKSKVKMYSQQITVDLKEKLKIEIILISNNLFSILDKATKKNVIHKNNASRKKAVVSKLSNQIFKS